MRGWGKEQVCGEPSILQEFAETTTVDDNGGGISKHRLMLTLPTFYNITLVINDNCTAVPIELKNAFKCINGAAINALGRQVNSMTLMDAGVNTSLYISI